ncbi:unnamed protein product [Rotaria magnacalcarata]|uniref:Uncharacterized protein n=5 Tax=Rotaria magnacalcarata TaxID=392030 RepID=A0A815AEM2_9BILA|nr:unnamed protein product [Rotaria magnacalcarata]CAF1923145.1 unnamed protein product [Rotaria magnacalcarata]CAF1967704.1 unnamed protein product [Rotaria magnacalcarata]
MSMSNLAARNLVPEQITAALDVQSKSEMNLDEDDSDYEETSKSSTNTKNDKMRKVTHSEVERRRREKMNRYIDEIAQLLPIDAVKKLDKLTVLRVAVDTIKRLKGTSSKISSSGFGKQIYLSDNELLELVLATIDQLASYFFLIIECQKGRICFASSSTETTLGYKPNELYLQSIMDIVCPDDIEIVRQQLISEKKTSSSLSSSSSTITSSEDSTSDSKCIPLLPVIESCLEVGNRRTFSCRMKSKVKGSNKTTTTTNQTDNYIAIDIVGYIKQYSLTNENQNEFKTRSDRRQSSFNALTPADVLHAIGTAPVSCLITMGNLCRRIEKANQTYENINVTDRMFLCKLNPGGQFTYFDQICYSLVGYLSQDLLGMNLTDFIHEEDRNNISDTWNRVCRDRQIVTSGNYRFRTKDNSYIILQTIFEPFINPWNNEIEIIVARNKTKTKPVRTTMPSSKKNGNPSSVDMDTSSTLDSDDLIRQLLP